LHGNVIFPDSFLVGGLAAPNLTIKRKQYDDAALVRTIRFGIRRDGTGIWLMPSQAFYHLDDQDIADVVAFVRSVPDDDRLQPESGAGPVTRWNLFTGVWHLVPDIVPVGAARLGDSPRVDDLARGRYIATIACGECHGLDQKGDPEGGVPNLVVAKAYDLDEFRALMHDGIGKDGRKLKGMMAGAAKWRFSAFTDDEIAVLKAYLDARAP
jgi:mono/diheme cytochrome c family protein